MLNPAIYEKVSYIAVTFYLYNIYELEKYYFEIQIFSFKKLIKWVSYKTSTADFIFVSRETLKLKSEPTYIPYAYNKIKNFSPHPE